jgi:hypothetical protein
MKIFFTNCEGGGFAGEAEIQENLTVGAFFKERFPERAPSDFLIRAFSHFSSLPTPRGSHFPAT